MIGDEIEASFTIHNCETIKYANASWIVRREGSEGDLDSSGQSFVIKEKIDITSTSGVCSAKMQYGKAIFLVIEAYTEDEKVIYYKSKEIPVVEPEEIDIEITGMDQVAYLLKPFSIHYRVTGGKLPYYQVVADGLEHAGSKMSLGVCGDYSTEQEGILTLIPTVGTSMEIIISVTDNRYAEKTKSFGFVDILPNPDNNPIECSSDNYYINVGEKVTVNYSIPDLDSLLYAVAYWNIGVKDNESEWHYEREINKTKLSTNSGTLSFIPTYGEELILIIEGAQLDGFTMIKSETIVIGHGEKIIRLPSGLQVIKAESFRGCTFTEIVIPESVIEIEENAIPDSCLIICSQGSYAQRWAIDNNYSFKIIR